MPGPDSNQVILIYPRTLWDIVNVTTRLPLATLYIGTVLQEHGYPVQIIDQRVDDDWPGTLRRISQRIRIGGRLFSRVPGRYLLCPRGCSGSSCNRRKQRWPHTR